MIVSLVSAAVLLSPITIHALAYIEKPMSWSAAKQYCRQECDSDLFTGVAGTAEFENDINEMSLSFKYAWVDSQPHVGYCSAIITDAKSSDINGGLKRTTQQCDQEYPFICNKCAANTNDKRRQLQQVDNPENVTYYFLSASWMDYTSSRSWCQNVCGSDLGSLHSQADWTLIKNLASDATEPANVNYSNKSRLSANNIRTGLVSDDTAAMFYYVDGTVFDFGYANLTTHWKAGIDPWTANNPNDDEFGTEFICNVLRWDDAYELADKRKFCTQQTRFMCNACDGELQKFFVTADLERTYDAQQTYCATYFGTDLASIHSRYDFERAQELCQLVAGVTGQCRIGLMGVDDDTETETDTGSFSYSYSDGSSFDFAADFDVSFWGTTTDVGCVQFDAATGFKLNFASCSATTAAVCAYPSSLCDASDWTRIYDGDSDSGSGSSVVTWASSCEAEHVAVDTETVLMRHRQSVNYNGKFVVEHMFSFTAVQSGMGATAGVMIMFDECNWYYIGIRAESNRVVLRQQTTLSSSSNSSYETLASSDVIEIELNVFYVLKVTVVDSTRFTVTVNDVTYIDYQDDINLNLNPARLSGFIAVRNSYSTIRSKSVYTSGGLLYAVDSTDIVNNFATCFPPPSTDRPTTEPTIEPTTSNPTTFPPTLEPTMLVTNDSLPVYSTADPGKNGNNLSNLTLTLIIVIVSLVVCGVCCFAAVVFYFRQKAGGTSENSRSWLPDLPVEIRSIEPGQFKYQYSQNSATGNEGGGEEDGEGTPEAEGQLRQQSVYVTTGLGVTTDGTPAEDEVELARQISPVGPALRPSYQSGSDSEELYD